MFNKHFFDLKGHGTTVRREVMAGLIGFFTILYIIAVNSFILSESGMPLDGAVVATVVTSFAGCLLMGLWANAPILLVPGMGINAMFTYTLVGSMGLSWQEALGLVFVAGLLFVVVAFTRLAGVLSRAIPQSLKEAITVGLGLFLIFIGLEKGGLIKRGSNSIIELGNLADPTVIATVLTFLVAVILFLRNVSGHFLWSILAGTGLAALLGILPGKTEAAPSISSYGDVFSAFSFDGLGSAAFLIGTFSLTMVIVFENIGLVQAHLDTAGRPEKFRKAFQANAVSAMLSGLFGSSPTVSTAETGAAIAAGGRTGLTAIVTGVLFLASLLFLPFIHLIPDNAIAPILLIIGGLMVQNIRNIDLGDLTEAFPAIFLIAMIPFTQSIADGIAVGFILYPLLKLADGKAKEVAKPLYVIAFLFLLNFVVGIA
ncbi:NCS2 family permease [Edaphobacillus lindanitolerans]|uniref:Putative MFS transporter, AGZA family, xanthine/uracil permease n=1 Tax=Edaphobacillus lindanitolerans TaxID=550447 RepID=A0A1U7PMH2_9BACI|nr:NCS2 family permease [Edaphobacillus lindanitolerans]SIT84542.1 putative MFS transporter, AGZA family, xanthine/uracil permease [Edaphobacillus lindanitolerans]